MTERAHSRFAPSSLERILACPRSVLLAEAVGGQGTSSPYAAEGSVAHMVAEAHLRRQTHRLCQDGDLTVGTVIEHDGHAITIDDAMHEHGVAYAAYVNSLVPPDATKPFSLWIEETVRLDEIVGPAAAMYGHLDAAVWDPDTGTLHVIDYKYGAGVRVDPYDNPQLKAYALGAMCSLQGLDKNAVRTVTLHVFQPRMNNIAHDTLSTLDLMLWGEEVLSPTVTAILQRAVPNTYVTGDHCRWCPAAAHCPALRKRATATAQAAFADPQATPRALSTAEIGRVLDEIGVIEPWIDAVRAEAKRRAQEDHDVAPGYKLVEGRASRVWTATLAQITPMLRRMKLRKAEYMTEPALKTVAQIERLVKAKAPAQLDAFNTLWERRHGAPSLVKESNQKPSVSAETASDVFARAPAPPTDLY